MPAVGNLPPRLFVGFAGDLVATEMGRQFIVIVC
jgi:hypothetical protein